MKLSAQGSDEKGYIISMQDMGGNSQSFVSRDDGRYVIAAEDNRPFEAGNEVLYLLGQKRDAEARALLDWMREQTHLGGGDDPLSGPLFPRFWTLDEEGNEAAMRLAAESLIATTPTIVPYLPQIRAAWESARNAENKLNLELLLVHGYWYAKDGLAMKRISSQILASYPSSYTAIRLVGNADALLKDWNQWYTMLDARIAQHSDDETLLRIKARALELQGYFVDERQTRAESYRSRQSHGPGLQRLCLERALRWQGRRHCCEIRAAGCPAHKQLRV